MIQPRNVRELEDRLKKLEDRNSRLWQELKENDQKFTKVATRINKTALTLAKVMEVTAHPCKVLVKAKLFDSVFEEVQKFSGLTAKKFVGVMVEYQTKMEVILEECRKVNAGIHRDLGKGKQVVVWADLPARSLSDPVTLPESEFRTPVQELS